MADLTNIPPPVSPPPVNGQPIVVAGAIIVAIGALYVGAGIFVPLVLAILLTFALAPVVRTLEKLHLPHIGAVLLSVLGAAMVLGLLAFLIITQLAHLASEMPQYQQIVAKKIQVLQQSTTGGELFGRLTEAIKDFGNDAGTVSQSGLGGSSPPPTPVTIVNPSQNPLGVVQTLLGSLLGPLATAAIVTVFVVFLLLEREDFRDRFLKLVSRGDLRTSTQAMNEAGKRVSRYLLVQFTVNLSYGIVFAAGLFVIGIPNAILWGLFAALFRYIPFVGTLIAASIPFSLAFAIDPGWGLLLQAVALFVCLELVVTNAIEPRLYGSSTGLSALAVIVAAMFWATLWGPIGLILATPLTVCLVVLGRYVPQLRFLEIMLGSQPVLVREEQLYQRLISANTEEAIDLAETEVAATSAIAFYDNVAIPALRLAEVDRARNKTDVASRRTIAEGMAAIVKEIENTAETDDNKTVEFVGQPLTVLCIGGRTELDAASAAMVAQVLKRPGINVQTMPPVVVRQESIGQIDLAGVDIVCLVYLDPNPRTYARFVARRLKRRAPRLKIMACVFNAASQQNSDPIALKFEVDAIAGSIAAVESQIVEIAKTHSMSVAETPAPEADTLSERARLLQNLERLSKKNGYAETFTKEVALAHNSQLAMVEWVADANGTSDGATMESNVPAGVSSLSQDVVANNDLLVIEDVAEDAAFSENAFLLENSIRFFAGIPLRLKSGQAVGALTVIHTEPRGFSEADRALIVEQAEEFMAHVLSTSSGSTQENEPVAALAIDHD